MAKASLVLGLSGRGLRDLDLFSKSDPYVVLSRQASPGGAWVAVRTSETINNNLNPDWKEFLIPEAELGTGPNDDIQLEVFDDDGKPGKDRTDQSIGFLKTRVSRLVQGQTLTLHCRKKGKEVGRIMVRSLKRNPGTQAATKGAYPAPAGGYPAPSAPAGGYPAPSAPAGGYPVPGGGYPAPAGGYPAPAGGYPAPAVGYPAPSAGYPAPSGDYPTAPAGHPASAGGFTLAPAPGSVPGGYPGAPPLPAEGAPYPAPAQGIYPAVPPAASAALPYPVHPSAGMVHHAPHHAPPGAPQQAGKPEGRTGLIGQMQGVLAPGQGGGFRLP